LLDVEAEEPDSIKTWLSDVNAAPHGGESIARVLQRIATWLDLRIGDDGHGIAVTHAAVVRGAILHAVGAPAQSFWHIDVGPLSVPELRNDGFRWRWRDQPDMQISRIRLSDKTSRLHPRHVVPKPAQAYEPEVPVKVREWISPALASAQTIYNWNDFRSERSAPAILFPTLGFEGGGCSVRI
jgi:hypothetical protein